MSRIIFLTLALVAAGCTGSDNALQPLPDALTLTFQEGVGATGENVPDLVYTSADAVLNAEIKAEMGGAETSRDKEVIDWINSKVQAMRGSETQKAAQNVTWGQIKAIFAGGGKGDD
jgi:hypothetical protein